jgi:hypothetical protein
MSQAARTFVFKDGQQASVKREAYQKNGYIEQQITIQADNSW